VIVKGATPHLCVLANNEPEFRELQNSYRSHTSLPVAPHITFYMYTCHAPPVLSMRKKVAC